MPDEVISPASVVAADAELVPSETVVVTTSVTVLLVDVAAEPVESVIVFIEPEVAVSSPAVVTVPLEIVVVTTSVTVLRVESVVEPVDSVTVAVETVDLSCPLLLLAVAADTELVILETVVVTNSVTVLRVEDAAEPVDSVSVSPAPEVTVSASVASVEVELSEDSISMTVVVFVVAAPVLEPEIVMAELLAKVVPVGVLDRTTVSVLPTVATVEGIVEERVPLIMDVLVSVLTEPGALEEPVDTGTVKPPPSVAVLTSVVTVSVPVELTAGMEVTVVGVTAVPSDD